MSQGTSIQWTDISWNPVRGCSRVSAGCEHCYAERQAARFSGPGNYAHGFVKRGPRGPRWTGRVELVPEKLREPLSWRRPRRVFVNSMSDLFHEALPDEAIDRVFAVMALAPQHTFQVLTKRPERMRAYFADLKNRRRAVMVAAGGLRAPLLPLIDWRPPGANVWLGVSVEDQASADKRIPLLLDTPAAVRWISAEPLLEAVNLRRLLPGGEPNPAHQCLQYDALAGTRLDIYDWKTKACERLDWVVVGGESGPGARSCDVEWIRDVLKQCQEFRCPVFVKQLGASPYQDADGAVALEFLKPRDRKGGNMLEWPEDLRVREFPARREP